VCIADSAATNEQYAKRAVELGHKVISSVEHGWQGYYYQCYELAQKYNLKFVFGAEAYWVKDRQKEYEEIDPSTGEPLKNKDGTIKTHKDKSNCHILLLAKTEIGRRAINKILSEANETGYYFRPRVDLELLLSLPPEDVVVTTACVAYWKYEDIEDITLQLWKHFGKNFYLEIQAHDTDRQREVSRRILSLSKKYGIEMIVGLDSHYIYPEQAQEREYILEAKDVKYEDEEGWYMDYPDDEEVMRRFMKQGVFTKEQVQRAMDNTDISLTFDDYAKDNPVFSKDIKLPTLYPNLSQEERNKKYSVLISKLFKEYAEKHHITGEEYKRYLEGIKMEVQTVKDTGMADYFLLDYEIVKKAIEKGGVLTDSGRGSSVGYFTNTLLGFSKVDRFQSPITLYPERFISKTRILETHSLPDIDMNWGTPEIAEEAQKEILGDNHAIPMIAFGTCKKKSAFKLFARSQNMDFELANTISSQIADYEEAVKNAEDDDKDQIDIYDFVDKKYSNYIEQSKKYWGIIMDKKKAPCAFLLYQGNIREEIGLIKCKSESTGKEFLTAVVDGAIAENYKFLKNDILCVSIVLLVDKIYRRIGIPHKTVEELKDFVKNDPKTWDIYKNGYTLGVNQCEQVSSAKKMMRFQAKNISELSAWIAAIRPSFKSMYSKFESRESFSYGIPAFDKLLQTEELPQSWILYQEQSMSVLSYAGFPMDECYGIIKAIAKKHPEKVRPLKDRFIEGFKKRIVTEEGIEEIQAQEMSERVWQIINDSCGYGFNSAHAYCMAIDSLSCAMLKANYPYEFYEVLLQFHSDRGEKDKVGALKAEMKKAFGIQEGPYRFGEDNRKFNAIPERGIIQPSLLSIKGLSQDLANDLYELSQTKRFDNFIDLLREFDHMKSMNVAKLDTLIKIGYFSQFAPIGKLLNIVEIYNKFGTRKTLKESDVLSLPTPVQEVIAKYTVKPKTQYKITDNDGMLRELAELVGERPITMMMRLSWEKELLGYCASTDQSQQGSWLVLDIDTKYSPKLSIYAIWSGEQRIVKVSKRDFQSNPLTKGDTIRLTIEQRPKTKLVDGQWVKDESVKEDWLKYYSIVK
jgi:DNA polymerase III alpha subunit